MYDIDGCGMKEGVHHPACKKSCLNNSEKFTFGDGPDLY